MKQETTKARIEKSELISLYGHFLAQSAREGDAVWARSNFLAAINLALFGAYGYGAAESSGIPLDFLPFICASGIIHSAANIFVVANLWKWSDFWKERARLIEERINTEETDIIHPSLKQPLNSTTPCYRKVLQNQPIHLVFLIGWSLLLPWEILY